MRYRIPGANEAVPAAYLQALGEIERLATQLDAQFTLPLTNIRFGWDPVVCLVPIAGDVVSLALSFRIIASARKLGASRRAIRRMVWNATIDAVVGAIPIAGTAFDVLFRANLRNLDLLMDEIRRSRAASD